MGVKATARFGLFGLENTIAFVFGLSAAAISSSVTQKSRSGSVRMKPTSAPVAAKVAG